MPRAFLLSVIFALPGAVQAQVNFDSAGGGDISSMFDQGPDLAKMAPVPAEADEAGCEPFSTESSMSRLPVYDQQFGGNPDNDSGICFAVVAAQMFDHWDMTAGRRSAGLVSPMMLAAARSQRLAAAGAREEGGGELTEASINEMAADACTFGLTPGSRRTLSIDEELGLAGLQAGSGGHKQLMDPQVFRGVPCRAAPASGFRPVYRRTRQVAAPNGGLRGVPFTVADIREFFSGNTARQPVAVKGNYGSMFGTRPGGVPHWALVTARERRDGRCMYLLRNSMGADTPSRWMEETAFAAIVRSMALLGR